MSPQFEHAAAIIVGVSFLVFGTGSLLLVLALRAFKKAKSGDVMPFVFLAVAIGFILFSCVGLLVWSALQRG